MTIRLATHGDIPRILEIRDRAGENPLSDPQPVTEEGAVRFVEKRALWVWQEPDGTVAGFSAGDTRDGSIWALLVAQGYEGKGIGRALLSAACDALREAGCRVATLRPETGSRAERHYRADGWTVAGANSDAKLILRKAL